MNRRGFLFGLGATVAAAVAPVKALARTIGLPRLSPASTPIGSKLTVFSREISREYIQQNLFSPFDGTAIYNGVIVRETDALQELAGGLRVFTQELPDVTEWEDDDDDDLE